MHIGKPKSIRSDLAGGKIRAFPSRLQKICKFLSAGVYDSLMGKVSLDMETTLTYRILADIDCIQSQATESILLICAGFKSKT